MDAECKEYEMIEKYFANQRYYCGGPIPRHLLMTPKNKQLLKVELADAISIVQAGLDRTRTLARTKWKPKVGQYMIPKILYALQSINAPKEMMGGMMLLHVELVEACSWRHLVNEGYKLHAQKPDQAK